MSKVLPLALSFLELTARPSPGQSYVLLHSFSGSDGARPHANLLLAGSTLYGTTSEGGVTNLGTVFRIQTDGSGFAVIKHFLGTDGANPFAGLTISGTTLYGTAAYGSAPNGGGTLFKLNVDGTGFEVVHGFNLDSLGIWPQADLVISGDTIYGTTELGGFGHGTVFKVSTNGTGFTVLKRFGAADGANPRAGLILSGTTLYGTTSGHMYPGNGTIFQLNTDGTGFRVLREMEFIGSCNRLFSPLVLSGTTLYGSASEDNVYGTVFKINIDGTGYTVLLNLTNNYGAWAWPGVAGPMLSGNVLYGTTGGSPPYWINTNCGSVFQVNTDGSGFGVLKSFTGDLDGGIPAAGVTAAGRTLYGTTSYGGGSNEGVIFAIGYPPNVLTAPSTQTAEDGSTVRLGVTSGGSPPISCQWFYNGSALSAGTDTILELTRVSALNAGAYCAVITNIFGGTTSAVATLSVISPVDRRPVPALELFGDAGSSLNLDYATSIAPGPNWLPLETVSLTSTSRLYFDLTAPLAQERYYRAWQAGTPTLPPWLKFPVIVPAISLRGNLGDQLRLDYINQIGPTNAWLTLDTVTLTNTSQLYFDTSAPTQPPRLYRIVPAP